MSQVSELYFHLIKLTPSLASRAFVEPVDVSRKQSNTSIHLVVKYAPLVAKPQEIVTHQIPVTYRKRALNRTPISPTTYLNENSTSPPTPKIIPKQWCPSCFLPSREVVIGPNLGSEAVSVRDVFNGLKELLKECFNIRQIIENLGSLPPYFWPPRQDFPTGIGMRLIAEHPFRVLRACHLESAGGGDVTIEVYLDCPCRMCDDHAFYH
ncbi:hypothetical protein TWF481_003296 [Arthrobotrys musiformis]|uniref:Uncharacterized protein n=1 Tax=Arthrobotrys musiformis TaxID=47236 RepID=A0AAV9VQW3_9PEZI